MSPAHVVVVKNTKTVMVPLRLKSFFIGLIAAMALPVLGQEKGVVNLYSNPAIESMRMAIRNPKDTLAEGFRLQLVSSENLGEVRRAREKFRNLYPDQQSYLKYEAPNLKLRVGNFRYPAEAQYLFYKLKEEFPYLFIVPDKVEARFLN